MKVTLTVKKEFDVKKLKVIAEVRYWEDATVNAQTDDDGSLIPCRNGNVWQPIINLESGVIENWEQGKVADIHYKVCDAGTYGLLDEAGAVVIKINGYVPDMMCPEGGGYGDYIIMKVDENGKIANFEASFDEFERAAQDD